MMPLDIKSQQRLDYYDTAGLLLVKKFILPTI